MWEGEKNADRAPLKREAKYRPPPLGKQFNNTVIHTQELSVSILHHVKSLLI